jgi:hypothetical protein
MGKEEWHKMLSFHKNEVARLQALSPSCHSCSQYMMRDKTCAKFNARPPDEVLAEGCDEWDMDSIPF